MTLPIRKLLVLCAVGLIILLANVTLIATWIDQMGLDDLASFIRKEFLTGTAVTIIVVLLILLVQPKSDGSHRCPVCNSKGEGGNYCRECGSRTS